MIPFGNKVRIQVPVELQRRATKLLNSHKYKNQKSKINEDQPLLIKCPYHPHRLNQTYPTNKIPLSSLNWNGQRSKGRTFSFLPVVGSKPHPKDNDFSCLGLHDSLPSLLKAHNFKAPTNIQALAIPQILGAESDILIASETGNGKTLSFLLPLLHGLLKSPNPDNLPPLNSPRAIIAVPSRELAQQIYKLSLSLTQDLGLSSHLLMGGSTKNKAVYGPREHMDVLVCSLGALHKYLSNGYLKSSQARYLVFDEADSLLDDTFSRISSNIIASVQKSRRGEPCQLIFSGATMPRTLNDALGSVLDVEGIIHIKSNSLHRVPVHIKQKFVRTSKAGRLPILFREIEKDILNKRKVLIFVNKASTSIWLERTLNKENVKAQCFSQIISYKYRHEQINKFLDPSGDTHVLVATDLASRGLDFDASLAHVVNYDFPHNMSDYIHRIGRVGRIGSINAQARVLNLISNPWNVELTQKIERTLRLNTVLPNVNSNIVRIIEKRRREASIGLTEEDGEME